MADVEVVRRTDREREAEASLSGISEGEAKAFNSFFILSFLGFLGIAIIAHILVWQWRPWIPGAAGYPAVQPTAQAPVHAGPVVASNVHLR